jgi:hypothetical protein
MQEKIGLFIRLTGASKLGFDCSPDDVSFSFLHPNTTSADTAEHLAINMNHAKEPHLITS